MRELAPILVGVLMLSGCATAANPGLQRAIDDAKVTTEVKTVFLNHPSLAIARIDVETSAGVVTLSGRVTSKDEEATAIALARTVKGVVDVKSTLQIE